MRLSTLRVQATADDESRGTIIMKYKAYVREFALTVFPGDWHERQSRGEEYMHSISVTRREKLDIRALLAEIGWEGECMPRAIAQFCAAATELHNDGEKSSAAQALDLAERLASLIMQEGWQAPRREAGSALHVGHLPDRSNMSTYTANDILERLRALGACGDAVRPEPTEECNIGWVVEYLETHPPDPRDLWRRAVDDHLADAWWLASRLGVARDALGDACRRALTYAAEAAEAAGLDGAELRRAAEAEVLDHKAAEAVADAAVRAAADAARTAHAAAWAAVRAAEDTARAARAAAWAAAEAADADAAGAAPGAAADAADAWAAVWAAEDTADAAGTTGAAVEAAEAAAGAGAAEFDQQREDLLALWPEVYAALKGVT